jgi:hypothetical protein
LIRFLSRGHRAFLALGAITLPLACHPGVDAPGMPLYPNAQTTPLPRDQIARVAGPIAKIDGKDVQEQGGRFELLPGCHVIELDRRMVADAYALSGGSYWTGQFPRTVYAMVMKAGARYDIRREIYSDGSTGRLVLSATEEQAGGTVTDLVPAKSAAEIQACR